MKEVKGGLINALTVFDLLINALIIFLLIKGSIDVIGFVLVFIITNVLLLFILIKSLYKFKYNESKLIVENLIDFSFYKEFRYEDIKEVSCYAEVFSGTSIKISTKEGSFNYAVNNLTTSELTEYVDKINEMIIAFPPSSRAND